MDVNHQCAAPLDIDPRQRYFTTVQPFSYRDTLTVLGYVQEIAEHIDELREQLDNLAKDEAADIKTINGILDRIAAWRSSVDDALDDIERKLDGYQASAPAYNPTTGRYECSKNVNRDMYRELAVFGARVDQMATMTAGEAAAHDCLTWAIVGNREIFGNTEPRVTPRERTQRQ
nr:MAG TPA: hypothetical protein [Caudoviricetes sp.]